MCSAVLDPDTESSAERRLYDTFARELNDEWIVFRHVKWVSDGSPSRP
jgi:hypothetical protein